MTWEQDETTKNWQTRDKIYEIHVLKHVIKLYFYGKFYSNYESVDMAKRDAIKHRDRFIVTLQQL